MRRLGNHVSDLVAAIVVTAAWGPLQGVRGWIFCRRVLRRAAETMDQGGKWANVTHEPLDGES